MDLHDGLFRKAFANRNRISFRLVLQMLQLAAAGLDSSLLMFGRYCDNKLVAYVQNRSYLTIFNVFCGCCGKSRNRRHLFSLKCRNFYR